MSDPRTEAATAVVNVRVVPGHVAEFVDWQNGMNDVVSHFDGFVSTNVVTPVDPANDDFVIIYQFAVGPTAQGVDGFRSTPRDAR